MLRNLKWINLAISRNIKKFPNLSTATNLEELNLSECSSLVELPSTIGNATNLKELHLSGCSSLVELPSSIGNLRKLRSLFLNECSKLKALPININTESLGSLNLANCWSLKQFPEISTNIYDLDLTGTSIKEVPCSIMSWSHLNHLIMTYSENLKEFPYIHDIITELHLRDTRIKELGPWVSGLSRLFRLEVNGMQKLVSLPQLPDSLRFLDAENCESQEKLDCSFCNPYISLNFINCFKLNQNAVLPGKEVPECFTYRAFGSSVTVKLSQKPLHTSRKLKACILFENKGEHRLASTSGIVKFRFQSKQNALTERFLYTIVTEHLYIFDIEAEEVTSSELGFEFEFKEIGCNTPSETWEIKECGIIQFLERHIDEEDERFRGGDEAMFEREDRGSMKCLMTDLYQP